MPSLIDVLSAGNPEMELHFLPSDTRLTYAEVWEQSERVARAIRARIGEGSAVASVLTNTPAVVPNIFGIWRSANDLVSLPHPGRGASIERYQEQIEIMLKLSGAQLMVVDGKFLPLIPDLSIPVVSYEEMLDGGPQVSLSGSGNLIQFTSGSVGRPKGVVLSGEAVLANINSLIALLKPQRGDGACSWLPLSHDMGFIGMFLTPMVCISSEVVGLGQFTLIDPEYFLANPQVWLETISDMRATITTAPNFAMSLVSRGRMLHKDLDLSCLHTVITGAERVSPATLRQFSETFADVGLDPTAICPAYGLAENTLGVSILSPTKHWQSVHLDKDALADDRVEFVAPDAADGDGALEYVGNGPPLPGVEVRIDADEGEIGEVQIRSEGLLSEYVGAELNLLDGGWFATRDRGFLHDSELFLVGRNDDTIIVAGKNYYSTDIEYAIEHPDVRKGNLAAVPEPVGYSVVFELARELDVEEQEALCREVASLAGRNAGVRPGRVAIVARGSLFKTPSGKLQRPLISKSLANGDLVPSASITFGGVQS
jgi:acyl-CoA synthetase (AMP-forming)/AMP-acid ligase II